MLRDVTMNDGDYTPEELDFIKAMERYMRVNRRKFPTFKEVLAVAKSLGYRKTARATELPKFCRGYAEIQEAKNEEGEK